jgi:hypothetical protein
LKLQCLAALSAAMMAACSATAAIAQSDYCLAQIAEVCGPFEIGACFSNDGAWAELDDECVGDAQTLIENAREAEEQDVGALDSGMSYGGVLRSGPGMNYRRIGSLSEGDWIEVLEATDEWMGDYQWFYVNSPLGEGYHWGGIFCTRDELDGVLTTCSEGF